MHDSQGFVIDRIQTGGVSSLNIPEEKVYELGNYNTVATVRDIPDLSFDLESFDVSTEIEALLLGIDPTTTVAGHEYDFIYAQPMDILSPFKSAKGLYNIVKGLVVPYLYLESVAYKFGNKQNATQTFNLRGDTVYYVPGTPYQQSYTGNGSTATFSFAHTALAYHESGDTIHALSVCVTTSAGVTTRLHYGDDYTDSTSALTLTAPATSAPAGSTIRVAYGSATAASYPQTVHQNVSTKPAAVRGKDIDVYVGDATATPTFTRWTGVQSFDVSRKVNLDKDEEFGNPHYVSQDYDVAEVSGSIAVKPRDTADLWAKLHQVANVPSNEVVGPLTSVGLPVELRISDPADGTLLKTLYIPDARFTVPGLQGRVQQKLETTFNFQSDGGTLLVYQGARP